MVVVDDEEMDADTDGDNFEAGSTECISVALLRNVDRSSGAEENDGIHWILRLGDVA